jgi:RND superfamily putative drug exporter
MGGLTPVTPGRATAIVAGMETVRLGIGTADPDEPARAAGPAGAGRSDGRAGGRGLTGRIAGWSIRRPWAAIGLWLAVIAAAVVSGNLAGTREVTDSDLAVGESGRAAQLREAAGFTDPATDNILVTGHGDRWDEAAARAAAAELTAGLLALPAVAAIGEPLTSPVADAVLVPLELATDPAGEVDLAPLLAAVAEADARHPQLRLEAVGGHSIGHGVDQVVQADLGRAGLLSIPVTLGILLVVFGALVAAGVPLLLSISAVAGATGLWGLASHLVPDIGTVTHLILLIGLAVGVDYSLFYLKRARQERSRGAGTVDAVRLAAATSGRAVVVSGLTSLVALAGLYLAGDPIFAALGTGVILAVAVSMVGSLTVLPALLVKLGGAVDRPRVPLLWRLATRTRPSRWWPVLLAPALRAPRTTLVVTLAGLAALAAPALGMSLKNSTAEDLPRSIPVVQGYDRLVAAFPREGETHTVVVRAPADRAEAVRTGLTALLEQADRDPLFAMDPMPAIRTSPTGTVSTVDVPYPHPYGSPAADASLARLRTELVPAAVGTIPGVAYAVGGDLADSVDYTTQQRRQLPWVMGAVVLLTVAMMALAFRSVVVAIVAGGLTLVSIAAAFGLLTLVFQHTWAEGLLDFTATGHIVSWIPLFLFVVLFGLSMDYHVYVVSRIREAAARGLPTRAAVREGLLDSAGVVTSAAVVMVAVFSIFAMLSLIEMKQLGVGLATAIAIDAVVVRIVLLPALMSLLGRANWWPSRLSRPRAH